MKLAVVIAVLAWTNVARAADDKDTSGTLTTWVVTKGGSELVGSESLRVVVKDGQGLFASGESKGSGKGKVHLKTHTQRGSDGQTTKYQRAVAGLKGAGLKLFEFEGQLRVAPLNAPGKPTPIGKAAIGRIWDADLWHLYALWELPKACGGEKTLGFFDPEKKAAGEARLVCEGTRQVFDAKKQPVDVAVWKVSGVPHEVELWVDGGGRLVGAKGKERWMLLSKWAWEADGKALGAGGEGTGDDDDKVDPGIGE